MVVLQVCQLDAHLREASREDAQHGGLGAEGAADDHQAVAHADHLVELDRLAPEELRELAGGVALLGNEKQEQDAEYMRLS